MALPTPRTMTRANHTACRKICQPPGLELWPCRKYPAEEIKARARIPARSLCWPLQPARLARRQRSRRSFRLLWAVTSEFPTPKLFEAQLIQTWRVKKYHPRKSLTWVRFWQPRCDNVVIMDGVRDAESQITNQRRCGTQSAWTERRSEPPDPCASQTSLDPPGVHFFCRLLKKLSILCRLLQKNLFLLQVLLQNLASKCHFEIGECRLWEGPGVRQFRPSVLRAGCDNWSVPLRGRTHCGLETAAPECLMQPASFDLAGDGLVSHGDLWRQEIELVTKARLVKSSFGVRAA